VIVDSSESGRPVIRSARRRELPMLEPFYYLQNFELVLATILERYTDLLLESERSFMNSFREAPRASRALLVRMVMRRGDLFRVSKLKYSEIGDTALAARPLIQAGWVDDHPKLSVEQLRGVFTKSELIGATGLPRRYQSWRKDDLLRFLSAQLMEAKEFAEWCSGSTDSLYRLLVAPICERFRLMYFGNYQQTWTEFVTADLKIFHYEKVDRTSHSRPFQTRRQIEVLEQLQACRELLEEGYALDELLPKVPEPVADSDWLEERRQKLLFGIARQYERAGDNEKAFSLYAQCTYRGARTRLIRLNSRLKNWSATLELCLKANGEPESEAERQYVRRVLPRVHKKLGLAGSNDRAPLVIPKFDLQFDAAPVGAVEYQVRNHLAANLTDPNSVHYVENGLINALFGLLCWRAIFAPIPGAFFHDFHYGPVDLTSGHFYQRRQRQFDECLSELESDCHRQTIWTTFKTKWGIQSPFVRWRAADKVLLRWALDCFPAAHLRLWFEWILRDVQDNRAGFPDLVQFWPEESRYRMIEVKGPGDRVQDNQRRFLEYCVEKGMPVSVCHVTWREPGSHQTTLYLGW
jgi:VRR-NUC domain